MSKFQKPALYQKRALDLQWINLIHSSHDLFCGCTTPIDHLQDILKQPSCHSGTKDSTKEENTTLTEDIGLSPGDLEKLFEEDDDGTG